VVVRYDNAYSPAYRVAAQVDSADRATFIRRTYAHLAGAILAFIGLETLLINLIPPQQIMEVLGASRFSWLLVLGAFMIASWVAQYWARSETSRTLQYLGLALYVVAQALIFLPLLSLAWFYTDDRALIPTAGILTLAVFGGLTVTVFLTRKDYSFLAPFLTVGSFLALGLIVAAIFFQGLSLGLWFSFFMVALLSGYILYFTSRILLYYRTDQYVAAALALFSSVATLFWYILRILMAFNRR
jgi:FtsH-binding integral membrane protein